MHGLHLYIQLDLFYFYKLSRHQRRGTSGTEAYGAIVDILHFIVGARFRCWASLCTVEMVFWRTVSQERYLS